MFQLGLTKPVLFKLQLEQTAYKKGLTRVVVFTHRHETVHRLALVLEQLGQKVQRGRVLDVVVCSDVMARGIDREGQLDNVISYDVPTYAKTYIHRVDRAGRECVAISLCEEKQVENILKMVKEARIEGVDELSVSNDKLSDKFAECLDVV